MNTPPRNRNRSFGAVQGELGLLLAKRRSIRKYSTSAIPLHSVSRILMAGQGMSSPDGKRTAPSAHALYPLQQYLLARRVAGLDCGFYVFESDDPKLRWMGPAFPAGSLMAASLADDRWLEDAAAIVVIVADRQKAIDHFADQQADGLRGLRYVDFEAGAVTQNMYLCATQEGLGGVVVMGVDDSKLKALLNMPAGIDPVALFCIGAIDASNSTP